MGQWSFPSDCMPKGAKPKHVGVENDKEELFVWARSLRREQRCFVDRIFPNFLEWWFAVTVYAAYLETITVNIKIVYHIFITRVIMGLYNDLGIHWKL